MSDKFRQAITKAWLRLEERQWVLGRMGRVNPSGSVTFNVPGRKGFVYVRVRNSVGAQSTVPARNDGAVPHTANLPVKMKLENGVYVIHSRTSRADLNEEPDTPPSGVFSHPLGEHSDVDFDDYIDGYVVTWNDSLGMFVLTEPTGGGVTSVNTQTGDVVLDSDDIAEGATNLYTTATSVAAAINGSSEKGTLADDDRIAGANSEASNALTWWTWSTIKTTLTSLFDTLYGRLAAANTWTQNNAFNSTASSGSAVSVTRNLASGSTDAPVVSIIQDNSGDDQSALEVTQDGSGLVAKLVGTQTLPRVHVEGQATSGSTAGIIFELSAYDGSAVSNGGFFLLTGNSWSFGTHPNNHLVLQSERANGLGLRTGAAPIIFFQGNASPNSSPEVARFASGVLLIGITSGGATKLGVEAGSSSNDAAVGGVLFVNTTVTNNIGTMKSYTVPANTLAVNGQSLWVEAWGTKDVSGGSVIALTFGGNPVVSLSVSGLGADHWHIKARIVRTGASAQTAVGDILMGSGGGGSLVTSHTVNLASSAAVAVVSSGGSSGDFTCNGMIVGFDDNNT